MSKLYTLRFFPPKEDVDDEPICFCTVKASEIPKRGHLVYLGNSHLLDNATTYRVIRVVRCYTSDPIDLKGTDGDNLNTIEITVEETNI